MISEERNTLISKQALTFPVGILIGSPKRRLVKLGRKPSSGSLQSSSSNTTIRSAEGVSVRQPARSKIRRHNNRFSTVFNRSTSVCDCDQRHVGTTAGLLLADDPSELSNQISTPGILKVFGNDLCQGAHYKSVLATTRSSAKELVKEAVERYCLDKAEADAFVLCDVIGHVGQDRQWKTECSRVVGDNEKPLVLQSLWKPKEGYSRRFEIQRRASVEERNAKEVDTVTAGINAQARKLQKVRSRVSSAFASGRSGRRGGCGGGGGAVDRGQGLWRSLSEMDLSSRDEEAGWGRDSPAQEGLDPEADKDARSVGPEKEDTESSDDNATQYSVHPPFDFPYFLLLEGYSHNQDFVLYPMSCSITMFGRCSDPPAGGDLEPPAVGVQLAAPDILPQHCCVRRLETPVPEDRRRSLTLLKPLHGGTVTCNGVPLKDEVQLQPGDLVRMGLHYTFMFKDPTALPASRSGPDCLAGHGSSWAEPAVCDACGSSLPKAQERLRVQESPLPCLKDSNKQDLVLLYEVEQEDCIVKEIITMVDPCSPAPKLTAAFLLCLCIQTSATSFDMADLRRLLLQIASQVQMTMWEKTKELAAMQTDTFDNGRPQEHGDVRLLTMEELIPGLQPLVLWMANSVELLHFIQQEVPKLLPWSLEGLLDSDLSRSAMEEAMTVLEEVIMFTFQQSVYYLTKTLYSALPALLDSNPFSESGQLLVPDGVSCILAVLRQTLQLLSSYQVHSDITSQLFAYLFFFINASLFNALMERGSGGGFYKWSKGVQIRANLDLLMDWIQSIGLSELALDFFQKLCSAVNLLATPKENLLQASWSSLREEFVHLNAAQLHHILREYDPGRACPAGWRPTPEDSDMAQSTGDILENFDNHPPLILPSTGFHLELDKPIKDHDLCVQLGRLQECFLGHHTGDISPTTKTVGEDQAVIRWHQDPQPAEESGNAETVASLRAREDLGVTDIVSSAENYVQACHATGSGSVTTYEAVLAEKLKSLEMQSALPGNTDLSCHKHLSLGASCLLTPPNTPQGQEVGEPEAALQKNTFQHTLNTSKEPALQKGTSQHTLNTSKEPALQKGTSQHTLNTIEEPAHHNTNGARPKDEDEEEEEEVFTVELQKGPHGLGLALVDGMKTSMKVNGIYIKSVIQESPAGQCKKLTQGDRILAVNGLSLVGLDYNSGWDAIRTSGDKLRLLVAKSELLSRRSPTTC